MAVGELSGVTTMKTLLLLRHAKSDWEASAMLRESAKRFVSASPCPI